jgi:hypothetical protein
MAHVRQQIRDALVAAVTGLATTGARVYRDRAYAIPETALPALRVYFWREQATIASAVRADGSYRLDRKAYFVVHAYTAGAGLDDQADAIADEVEVAIAADPFLGGLVKGCSLVQAEAAPFDGSGALRTGETVLVFETHYETTSKAPGSAI